MYILLLATEKIPGDDLHHLSGNVPLPSAQFAAMDQDGLQQVEAISADHLAGRGGAVIGVEGQVGGDGADRLGPQLGGRDGWCGQLDRITVVDDNPIIGHESARRCRCDGGSQVAVAADGAVGEQGERLRSAVIDEDTSMNRKGEGRGDAEQADHVIIPTRCDEATIRGDGGFIYAVGVLRERV
jgi:hypothetical protein